MKAPAALRALLGLYGLAWRAARPFLRRQRRLADGIGQRLVPPDWTPPADLWIQAASGGEAFLARQLLDELARCAEPLRILCTSCTRQGLDTLEAARLRIAGESPHLTIFTRFFPFDEPALMRRALDLAAPKLLVLLETELWPGLLAACAETDVPVALINGRMSEKSLRGYGKLGLLWRRAAPRRVLAVSHADAARFAALFGPARVALMPNMKFDGVGEPGAETADSGFPFASPFPDILPDGLPVLLLASVRKEEEDALLPVVAALREKAPQAAIVIAPRHMERVDAWLKKTTGPPPPGGIPKGRASRPPAARPAILLRSSGQAAGPGSIVIWDRFGELRSLYSRADAVFVGGSLAPLGGQNFLEPAVLGHVPVVGPHLKNFAWVGEDFFREGLARRVPDADALAPALLDALARPVPRERGARRTAAYLAPRRGGARAAGDLVRAMLER